MRSCAEELMDFCQEKGIGKAGETLFYGQGFNDEQNFDALMFNDVRGGYYERRLGGVALEHNFVEVQARGPIPGDVFVRLDTARRKMETMKGYVSDGGAHYESVLAVSAPRLLMYDRGRKYIYTLTMKVLRREQKVLDE